MYIVEGGRNLPGCLDYLLIHSVRMLRTSEGRYRRGLHKAQVMRTLSLSFQLLALPTRVVMYLSYCSIEWYFGYRAIQRTFFFFLQIQACVPLPGPKVNHFWPNLLPYVYPVS